MNNELSQHTNLENSKESILNKYENLIINIKRVYSKVSNNIKDINRDNVD